MKEEANFENQERIENKNDEKISFESKMAELEKIVNELEKGELNLDESLVKFEQGMKLSKECNNMLENAEKKITILLEQNGEIKEEDFNTDD